MAARLLALAVLVFLSFLFLLSTSGGDEQPTDGGGEHRVGADDGTHGGDAVVVGRRSALTIRRGGGGHGHGVGHGRGRGRGRGGGDNGRGPGTGTGTGATPGTPTVAFPRTVTTGHHPRGAAPPGPAGRRPPCAVLLGAAAAAAVALLRL